MFNTSANWIIVIGGLLFIMGFLSDARLFEYFGAIGFIVIFIGLLIAYIRTTQIMGARRKNAGSRDIEKPKNQGGNGKNK